jgi:predicted DsbA family dithiol-disulfide isomerase
LNTNTPPEGEDLLEHLMRKYGPEVVARFSRPDNPLTKAGSKCGISFNPNRRVIPTIMCHRAIEWCKSTYDLEKANSFMIALFQAYFESAVDVSKIENIVQCAASVEIDGALLEQELLNSTLFEKEVRGMDAVFKRNNGINGVPYFILEKSGKPKIQFSGAQVISLK